MSVRYDVTPDTVLRPSVLVGRDGSGPVAPDQRPRFGVSRKEIYLPLKGCIVTVEVIGSDIGDQEEASGLPLVGISADVKGGENRIVVIVGGREDADLTRIINTPGRIWHKQPQKVADEAIEIESDDGTTTLVTFHYVPPEDTEHQLPDKTRMQT